MRRILSPFAASAAGLALLLSGCSGESPTAPKTVPTPVPPGCNVALTLPAGPIEALGGTAVVVRATVKKNGQAVPDGTSVTFTTDFGYFLENGLPTVAKTTSAGAADVTPGALAAGTATVRATLECATATVQINYLAAPTSGPYISSIDPSSGSAKGGETVSILGGRFGTSAATTLVAFGGLPASVKSVTATQITVSTPSRTLADPTKPETVDVSVTVAGTTVTKAKAYTYFAIDPNKRVFVSNVSPNSGSPAGGEQVNVLGGNFGSSVATTRVTFCGLPATITAQGDTQITVLSPSKTLTDPLVSETCDVSVTTDLGLVSQQSAVLPQAYTYTPVAYQPVINSISPKVGPNDASTRVTIFGTGFQFPMQVFMTGGSCASQRIEGTILNPITLTNIVFGTPRATGPYACLANSLVDVEVLNPTTGKKASCPACFRYYGCPTVTGVSPALIPYDQTTLVTVSGNNFEEPVEATFQPTSPSGGAVRVNVTSVAAGSVIVQMPPLNQILQAGSGLTSCQNVVGTLTLTSTALTCQPVTTVVTYRVDPPSITSASPTNLNQDGSVFPAIGVPATITVLGTNFVDPVTVEITKGGASVATVNNAVVSNSGTLTFQAPALSDSLMNRQNCLSGGAVIGSKMVATSFGIRIRNQRTGCSAELPSILIYNPINGACTAGLSITTTSLPNAAVCAAYSGNVIAGGGVPPYLFSQSGLPAGFALNPATGVISSSGPQLTTGPVGGPVTANVNVTVTDNAAASVSQIFPLTILDPDGPFGVSGSATGSLPGGVTPGTVGPYAASPASTPAAFAPVTWSVVSVIPSPGGFLLNDPSGIFMTPGTGTSSSISFPGGVTGGTVYTVVIRAVDTPSCGGPAHQGDFTITVTKP
jgi:large repetitive protein